MNSDRIKLLLKAISNKDQEAYEQFFDHYYPRLIQLALAYVPGMVDAQEVVSDVLYKLLKKPKRLVKVSNFDGYIFRAVRNQSLTHLKKNRHRLFHSTIEQHEDFILPELKNPENSLITKELFNIVVNTIESLPPKRKIIFKLVKEEGKKYREVADILDISIKTVELQMSLAIKKVREVLLNYEQSWDIKVRPIRRTK